MPDTAIRIEKLGKRYRLGAPGRLRHRTLRETIADVVKTPSRNLKALRRLSSFPDLDATDVVWALSDVSFELKHGDVVGIIGPNGAGKSTLLKILSRITAPTTGTADVYGRIGSLLEVGTGFHPELTGRDNIYLNGSILGMDRRTIARRFDAIVDFAGVEKFIDTPVKRFSSGMYLRLAFAVAAHLDTDILIVDEVLAVGDAEFQKKCLGKMEGVAHSEGRTIIFVSHDMDAVQTLCRRAAILVDGRTDGLQDAETAVQRYLSSVRDRTFVSPLASRDLSAPAHKFVSLELIGRDGSPNLVRCGDPVSFRICATGLSGASHLECGIAITDLRGRRLALLHSRYHSGLSLTGGADLRLSCDVDRMMLSPGSYYIDLLLADGLNMIDVVERAGHFDVTFADIFGTGLLPGQEQGSTLLTARWSLG